MAAQVRNVNGRAMYQAGAYWNDSALQSGKARGAVQRIQFNSAEYFALLYKEPEVAQFYALGRNVRFVHREQVAGDGL